MQAALKAESARIGDMMAKNVMIAAAASTPDAAADAGDEEAGNSRRRRPPVVLMRLKSQSLTDLSRDEKVSRKKRRRWRRNPLRRSLSLDCAAGDSFIGVATCQKLS